MDGVAGRELGPVDVGTVSDNGDGGVVVLPHGVRHRDDGRVVDDEVAPDLLHRVAEVGAGRRRARGKIRTQIGAVVRRRHRELVSPGGSGPRAECLGDPLSRTVEDGLGREVEYRLLDSRRYTGLR